MEQELQKKNELKRLRDIEIEEDANNDLQIYGALGQGLLARTGQLDYQMKSDISSVHSDDKDKYDAAVNSGDQSQVRPPPNHPTNRWLPLNQQHQIPTELH